MKSKAFGYTLNITLIICATALLPAKCTQQRSEEKERIELKVISAHLVSSHLNAFCQSLNRLNWTHS